MFCAFTLVLLCAPGGHLDSHSLRYYYMGVSAPGHGMPDFSMIGYVDDQQIDLYRSDIGVSVPVAPWMKEKPEYWERSTQIGKQHEALYRHEVKIGMERFNHTGGFHFVQVLRSCELRDDGSTIAHQQYRYDGEEYMYFDLPTATFIPTMAEAQITTQRWNSPEVRGGERAKNYLENICIENLKRFLKYGRGNLERRVRPGVKVTGQKLGDITKLHCHVYGFHPRTVHVRWMKNGMDDIPSYETTHVLPNPDGTYQIRVSVDIRPNEGDTYSCYVDHSSLEEPLLVPWEQSPTSVLVVIISLVVTVILIVTSVIAGVTIYKRRKDDYTATSTSDTTSDSDRAVTA
ncbi:class I histocompatibility antigen, F10 alpha chain-like [Engystomops pustulosus]|uniref:class I histocompatibility antigen, F10 alpha chain-like n=1 Tax=Engystomops pustulosus TaxID=76066 RepID=UPI003AFA9F7F